MKALERSQHFSISPIVIQWGLFQTLKGSLLRSPRCDLHEIRAHTSLVVLITCSNEEHLSKTEGTRVVIIHQVFRRSMIAHSVVGDGIWPKFEIIQAFMVVLVACKNEEEHLKIKAL